LLLAIVGQLGLARQTVVRDLLEAELARLHQQVLPAEDALSVFTRRVGQERLTHIAVVALQQVEIAVVVQVAEVDVGSGFVAF